MDMAFDNYTKMMNGRETFPAGLNGLSFSTSEFLQYSKTNITFQQYLNLFQS